MGDWKKWLSYIGCGAVLLILFAFTAYFAGFHRGESGTGLTGGGGTGANCNILFPAGAGSDQEIAQAINQWIAQHGPNSDLKGKGVLFVQSGRAGGVNPALIAAIARKESTFGTQGIAAEGTFNPFGRKAIASQPHKVIRGVMWYKFSSWDEAILEEGPYLKRVYLDEGRTTLGKLFEKYAPPSENDTPTYIKEVASWINEMTALAGGALGQGCTIQYAQNAEGWIWPVEGTGPFESGFFCFQRSEPSPHLHNGIDIKAPNGTPVKATNGGTVIKVAQTGHNGGNGTFLTIDHGDGMQSIYLHLVVNSIQVKVGDIVSGGETVAQVDSTGYSGGPHLHFVIKKNDKYVDPLNYLPFKKGISDNPIRNNLCDEI